MLRGTDISVEAFQSTATVLHRTLDYSPDPTPAAAEASASRLMLNAASSAPRASIQVDAECKQRFYSLAAVHQWTAFQWDAARVFHVDKSNKLLFRRCTSLHGSWNGFAPEIRASWRQPCATLTAHLGQV